jgi:Na+-transporting NADH:ubiquinone oxidoreductase subunit NqrF
MTSDAPHLSPECYRDSLFEHHLEHHPNPAAAEYYLCGPPMMIKACTRMLSALGVPDSQVAYDEF